VADVHPVRAEADPVEVVLPLLVEHQEGLIDLSARMGDEVDLPCRADAVGRVLDPVAVPDRAVGGEPREVRPAPVRVDGRVVAGERGEIEDVAVLELDRDPRRTGADVVVLVELERQVRHAAPRLVQCEAGPAVERQVAVLRVVRFLVMADERVEAAVVPVAAVAASASTSASTRAPTHIVRPCM